MRTALACLAVLSLGLGATAAKAAGPEQLDQIEPGRGEWQAEYFGTFSKADENEQALEAMYGISDKVAVGIELEAERSDNGLAFDTLSAKALYRLTPPDAAIGAGLQLQAGFDDHASLAEVEARLLVEAQSDRWWSQANLMLRRSREESRSGVSGAYAWSVQRSIVKGAWLGAEGSGQVGRTSCDGDGCEHGGHFIGPSLTFEVEHGAGETEIGLAAMRSISGGDAHTVARLFVQLTF